MTKGFWQLLQAVVLLMLSGALTAGAFFHAYAGPLALVSLVPMLMVLLRSQKHCGRILFLFSLFFYLPLLTFLYGIQPSQWMDVSAATGFWGITILSVLISLILSLEMGLMGYIFGKLQGKHRGLLLLCLWIVLEFLRGYGPLGFTWGRLGNSQYANRWMIGSASLFGSLFTSALVLLVNLAIAEWILTKSWRGVRFTAVVLAANLAFGAFWAAGYQGDGSVPVSVAQGNFPSGHTPIGRSLVEERYLSLAAQAKGELVVLPENAIPLVLQNHQDTISAFQKLARENNVSYIVGAFDEEGEDMFTSLHLIDKDGHQATYRKRHLVPVGEYIPLEEVLTGAFPDIIEVLGGGSSLSPGKGSQLMDTQWGKIGCLICFDSTFPSLARESVRDGASLLVVSTNDSWFDGTAAKAQHLGQAVMRAVENGRYVVRAANTGISCVITPNGRITYKMEQGRDGVGEGSADFIKTQTLYTRIGDIIVLFALAGIAVITMKSKKYGG